MKISILHNYSKTYFNLYLSSQNYVVRNRWYYAKLCSFAIEYTLMETEIGRSLFLPERIIKVAQWDRHSFRKIIIWSLSHVKDKISFSNCYFLCIHFMKIKIHIKIMYYMCLEFQIYTFLSSAMIFFLNKLS